VLWIHSRSSISILDIYFPFISLPLHGYAGHVGHIKKFPTSWKIPLNGCIKGLPQTLGPVEMGHMPKGGENQDLFSY